MSVQLADTLHRLDAAIRPLSGVKPVPEGKRSLFSASLSNTVRVLRTELAALDAENVVLELDYREEDLRLDGYPRAQAKALTAAVAVSFQSRYGPQRYVTCTFDRWQDNLRGIALGLEALRKVDRYGISKRGEQYVGYRQIATRSQTFVSREQATLWLADHGGYRDAARRFHPDNAETGDEEKFKLLQQARQMIEAS